MFVKYSTKRLQSKVFDHEWKYSVSFTQRRMGAKSPKSKKIYLKNVCMYPRPKGERTVASFILS